jgi:hypothetical protein
MQLIRQMFKFAAAMAFLKPFLAVLLLATCGATFAQSQRTIGCVTSFNNTNNYFPAPFQIDVYAVPLGSNPVQAQDFTVQYNNTFKMVSNSFVNETYVGYQVDCPFPAALSASAYLPRLSKLVNLAECAFSLLLP